MPDTSWASAADIARAVSRGEMTAVDVIEATLRRIAERDRALNAFTAMTADRARLGHQWLDSRAGIAVLSVRAQADLRKAVARPHLPVRHESRSPRAARAQRARPCTRL